VKPIEIIYTKDNNIVPYREVEKIAKERPNVRVRLVERGGHDCLNGNPKAVSKAIRDLIDKHS
jgi:predicted alpha/beta-fold hydrolase